MSFDEWIRRVQAERGMTIGEIARRLGVWPQAIYRYRRGERRPSADFLRKVERLTGGAVTAETFAGRSDGRA